MVRVVAASDVSVDEVLTFILQLEPGHGKVFVRTDVSCPSRHIYSLEDGDEGSPWEDEE